MWTEEGKGTRKKTNWSTEAQDRHITKLAVRDRFATKCQFDGLEKKIDMLLCVYFIDEFEPRDFFYTVHN